jgi:dCMP deaminase
MEAGHCTRTIHAEANAIVSAARQGARSDGADLYVTASPCHPCFQLLANAGVRRIVYTTSYRADNGVTSLAAQVGIELADRGAA